ncbi:hypothetical protein AHAS_Ahas18G0095300 [Arachis hypogaea]
MNSPSLLCYGRFDTFNEDDLWSIDKVFRLIRNSAHDCSLIFSTKKKKLIPAFLSFSWVPLPPHFTKINSDASIFKHVHFAGFGCLIRDNDGEWMKGCSAAIPVESIVRFELFRIWQEVVTFQVVSV